MRKLPNGAMTMPAGSGHSWPLTSTTRVEATLSASRNKVANRRTVGKDEKSSGLTTFSATISTARLIMMLAMKPTSSRVGATGTTISITSINVANGRIAPLPASIQSLRFTAVTIASGSELGEHQIGQPCILGGRTRERLRTIGERRHPDRRKVRPGGRDSRSEEHTSELQSLMRNSYAVFC